MLEEDLCHHGYKATCEQCRLSALCLPIALHDEEIVRLDAIVKHPKPLQKGNRIYFEGDEFTSVYAVRSGCIKTYKTTEEGEELVTGFYFPGEIFGSDGIVNKYYMVSAEALDTTAICEIPFNQLEKLSSEIPELMHRFYEVMSNEIVQDQQFIAMLNKSNSELRLASLLLNISSRITREQDYAANFSLPMTRGDIANYLGLTIETVSRIIGKFKKSGLIEISGNNVSINTIPKLRQLTEGQQVA